MIPFGGAAPKTDRAIPEEPLRHTLSHLPRVPYRQHRSSDDLQAIRPGVIRGQQHPHTLYSRQRFHAAPSNTGSIMLRLSTRTSLVTLLCTLAPLSAQARPYGRGCKGPANDIPTLNGIGVPLVGSSVDVRLNVGIPKAPCMIIIGASSSSWGGIGLPFDVTTSLRAWQAGAPNHGWPILNPGARGWSFRSSEWSTAAERPMLTVVLDH